jgi:hypothetical protein
MEYVLEQPRLPDEPHVRDQVAALVTEYAECQDAETIGARNESRVRRQLAAIVPTARWLSLS